MAQLATGVNGQGQVVLSNKACSATSARLPLSTKGLRSGVTDFGNKWRCPVPAQVLMRARAVFQRPVTLQPAVDAPYLSIGRGKLLEGAIAVATKSREPIFYAAVRAKRDGTIFVARPRCQRNRF